MLSSLITGYYIYHFYQSLGTIVLDFLFSSEFDFAVYNCVNSIVRTDTDTFTGKKLCPSLSNYNIARYSYFTGIKLHAQILWL